MKGPNGINGTNFPAPDAHFNNTYLLKCAVYCKTCAGRMTSDLRFGLTIIRIPFTVVPALFVAVHL